MAERPVDLGWMRVLLESGRRGSLSAAAQELGLTQPAVSYQIRRLEEQLGVAVLHRQHRGVELTPEGQKLYRMVTQQVAELDQLVGEFRQSRQKAVIRLHTDYAFSSLWLIPRMQRFRERHPDINIQIVANQNPAGQSPGKDDVLVAFGERPDVEANPVLLLSEKVVPVCAPGFLHSPSLDCAAEPIGQSKLIHLDSMLSSQWFDWSGYLKRIGVSRGPASGHGDISFNTYTMVIEAALKSQGIALGWSGLVDSLVADGSLVQIGEMLEEPTRGYWLSGGADKGSAASKLTRWLMEEAGRR